MWCRVVILFERHKRFCCRTSLGKYEHFDNGRDTLDCMSAAKLMQWRFGARRAILCNHEIIVWFCSVISDMLAALYAPNRIFNDDVSA